MDSLSFRCSVYFVDSMTNKLEHFFRCVSFQVLIKNMLYGTSDAEPQTDYIVAQLSQELYNSNLLLLLIQVSKRRLRILFCQRARNNNDAACVLLQNLNRIDFEGKKDVAQVFNNVLRRQIGTRSPTVEYICTKPEILFTLMAGWVLIIKGCEIY